MQTYNFSGLSIRGQQMAIRRYWSEILTDEEETEDGDTLPTTSIELMQRIRHEIRIELEQPDRDYSLPLIPIMMHMFDFKCWRFNEHGERIA